MSGDPRARVEPPFVPKVRDRFVDFPRLHCSSKAVAERHGDQMRCSSTVLFNTRASFESHKALCNLSSCFVEWRSHPRRERLGTFKKHDREDSSFSPVLLFLSDYRRTKRAIPSALRAVSPRTLGVLASFRVLPLCRQGIGDAPLDSLVSCHGFSFVLLRKADEFDAFFFLSPRSRADEEVEGGD